MEKVKLRLYQLTLILSLISFALALLSSGKQREFFLYCGFASIIGLACEYKKNYPAPLFNRATHFADWAAQSCLVYGVRISQRRFKCLQRLSGRQ